MIRNNLLNSFISALVALPLASTAFAQDDEARAVERESGENAAELQRIPRQPQPFGAVRLFSHMNFSGRSLSLTIGSYSAAQGDFRTLGNSIGSAVVPQGLAVRLCERRAVGRFPGTCTILQSGRYAHLGNFAGRVRFVDVYRVNTSPNPDPIRQGVRVFSERNFFGNQQTFRQGIYLANRGGLAGIGNDQISSLIVPVGFTLRACTSEGFGRGAGFCQSFTAGRYAALPFTLDNQISYLEVRGFGGGYPGGGYPDDDRFGNGFGDGEYLERESDEATHNEK